MIEPPMQELTDCHPDETVTLDGEGSMTLRSAIGRVAARLPEIREYWRKRSPGDPSVGARYMPVIWREAGKTPPHLELVEIEQLAARPDFQSVAGD
jgi:hypothetical protein